jgi:uncharacterized protein (TIRG00374 family)
MKGRKIITYLIFIGISILLLYFTFRKTDFSVILANIAKAHLNYVLLCFLATMLAHFMRAWRWQNLLRPLGYEPRLRTGFYAILIGYLANYAIPRGGEVARCGIMQRTDRIPMDKLLGTVVTERIIDVLFMFLILMITWFVEFDKINSFIDFGSLFLHYKRLLLGIAVTGIIATLLIAVQWKKITGWPFVRKIINVLNGFNEGLMSVFKIKNQWLFWLQSAGIWISFYAINYCFMHAMDITAHLGWNIVLVVLTMGTVGFAIPLPGGTGSYHIIIQQTLMLYNLSKDDATTYAFSSHSAQLLFIVISGGISLILALWEAGKKNDQYEQSPEIAV